MMSKSVSGKVITMWMPILVFFYMGFEHSIVNMFLFPSGLMLGGNFTWGDYFLWNEIPTLVGNLVGGLTFVGATVYVTHHKTSPPRKAATVVHDTSPLPQESLLPEQSPCDETLAV